MESTQIIFRSNEQIKQFATKFNMKTFVGEDLILMCSNFEDKKKQYENNRPYKTIIIDKNNYDIVFLSHKRISYNDFTQISNLEISRRPRLICESLEGSSVYMYFHDGKWKTSSTSKLDARECWWKSIKKSLHDLFIDAITYPGGDSVVEWDRFCDKHDKNKMYTYSVIHFENIHLIDYSYRFGQNYKKVLFLHARHKHDMRLIADEPCVNHLNVIGNTLYTSYQILDKMNTDQYYVCHSSYIKHEGIAVIDLETEDIVKITTNCYGIAKLYNRVKFPRSAEHYISLYQNNLMDAYFERFSDESFYNLCPIKTIIHALFTYLTNYTHHLIDLLYDKNNEYEINYSSSYIYHNLSSNTKKLLCVFRRKKKLLSQITKNTIYYTLKGNIKSQDIILFFHERITDLLQGSDSHIEIITSYLNSNSYILCNKTTTMFE